MKRGVFYCFFFFLLIQCTFAYQEKMTLKECLFSFNDPNFTHYWDVNNNSGIFLNITNTNLVLGINEMQRYNYTVYQPPRIYYNSSYTSSELSLVPFINLRSGLEDFIYIKCTFIVGNFRIYFYQYNPFGFNGFLTTDFNLSTNIISSPLPDYLLRTIGLYNGTINKISYYPTVSILSSNQRVIYLDSGRGVFYGTMAEQSLFKDGFFENTMPVVISRINVTNLPPSLIYGFDFFTENGHASLLDRHAMANFFYLNSTNMNVEEFLLPYIENITILNVNKSISTSGRFILSPLINVSLGDRLNISFYFKNPFSVNLLNVMINNSLSSSNSCPGCAGSGTDVFTINFPLGSAILNFSPNQLRVINYSINVPNTNDYILPSIFTSSYLQRLNKPPLLASSIFGGDSNPYIYFYRLDPKIVYLPSTREKKFLLNTSFYVNNNSIENSNNIRVYPGDYSFIIQLYKDDYSNLIYTEKQNLSSFVFNSYFGSSSYLSIGNLYYYSFYVNISDNWIDPNETSSKFYVKLFSFKNNGVLADKKISTIMVNPYFELSNIIYPDSEGADFYFYLDSRTSTKKFHIFNPTFAKRNITLSFLNLPSNFTHDLTSNRIELNPLESRIIYLKINATHNPWPTDNSSQVYTIKASLNISEQGIMHESFLSGNLFVHSNAFEWFNFREPSLYTSNDSFDPGNTQNINFSWGFSGSDSGKANVEGKNYSSLVSIYKNESSIWVLHNYTKMNFSLNTSNDRNSINFSLFFPDNYTSIGRYNVTGFVDSENNITEILDNGATGESDNFISILFDVRGCVVLSESKGYVNDKSCFFNISDSYLYFCNIFSLFKESNCSRCSCPGGKRCGYDDLNLNGRCYSFGSYEECANFTDIDSCLNSSQTSGIICAWNSTSSTGNHCISCESEPISKKNFLFCSVYNNENTCNRNVCGMPSYVEVDGNNQRFLNCSWDSARGYCLTNTQFSTPSGTYNCNWIISSENRCDSEGTLRVSYSLSSSSNPACGSSYYRDYSCGKIVTLPFFTIINFFLSMFIIFLVYFFKKYV